MRYQPVHQYAGQIVSDVPASPASSDYQREMLFVYGGLALGIVLGVMLSPASRLIGGIVGAMAGGTLGGFIGVATAPQLPSQPLSGSFPSISSSSSSAPSSSSPSMVDV